MPIRITQWKGQLLEDEVGVFGGEAKAESTVTAIDLMFPHAYEAVQDARTSIGKYLEFYNFIRPRSILEAFTPDQVYFNRLPEFMAV